MFLNSVMFNILLEFYLLLNNLDLTGLNILSEKTGSVISLLKFK